MTALPVVDPSAPAPCGVEDDGDPALSLLLEAVARGVPQTLVAKGGSMRDAIPPGTRVELSPPRPAELGDVVCVRTEAGALLIHRVLGLRPDGAVLLRGDACKRTDGWFAPEEIRAHVLRIDRGQGWVRVPSKPRLPVPPPLWRRAAARLSRALR